MCLVTLRRSSGGGSSRSGTRTVPVIASSRNPDLSKGILDAIDLDSYRVEKQAMQKILLPDEEAEIGPVPTSAGGHRPEPELDRLSNILRTFNEHFGDIRWEDDDRVTQLIIETIPARVAADTAFRNARQNSDRQNARIEHDKALLRVMTAVMRDDTELFKQFMDNASFKRWLNDTVFRSRLRADRHATHGWIMERRESALTNAV